MKMLSRLGSHVKENSCEYWAGPARKYPYKVVINPRGIFCSKFSTLLFVLEWKQQ